MFGRGFRVEWMTAAAKLFQGIDAVGEGEVVFYLGILRRLPGGRLQFIIQVPFKKYVVHLTLLRKAFEIQLLQFLQIVMIEGFQPETFFRGYPSILVAATASKTK